MAPYAEPILDSGTILATAGHMAADAHVPMATRAELKEAIAYLSRCPEHRPPVRDAQAKQKLASVVAEVLSLESESRTLGEEAELVADRIEQTRPWGDFRVPSESELGGRRLFFYRLTHRQASGPVAELLARTHATMVRQDRQYEYWVVVA